MLDRHEVQVGELLGQGNFSNVFEVVGFGLQNQVTHREGSACPGKTKENQQNPFNDHSEDNSSITANPQGPKTTITRSERKLTQKKPSRAEVDVSEKTVSTILLQSDEDIKGKYAFKCLKPDLLARPKPTVFLEAAADLVIEAQFLAKLNHPNILKVRGLAKGWESAFENGEYDSFFLVMDRLEETLSQRVKRWRQGELSRENTTENKCNIALQIASALNHLHERNLIFRDLKVRLGWHVALELAGSVQV